MQASEPHISCLHQRLVYKRFYLPNRLALFPQTPSPHNTMASSEQERFNSCYQQWANQQQQDLKELLRSYNQDPQDPDRLAQLVAENVQHYQDYCEQRTRLAAEDPPSFFSPTWCTSLENSFLWIAGCRPSLSIRLVYSLSGSQLELQLSEYLKGVRRGNLAELSPHQMESINKLHCNTIREEDKLSRRMASLQEDMGDLPLVRIASERGRGGSEDESDRAIQDYLAALANLLEEADKLRLRTLKELVDILTPSQAAEYLIAAKQLRLSVHEWGKRRDRQHGRFHLHPS
ncbi:protein DOG1-like 3 [Magnolia sinica]|uniref:protein DOG1-like 3 n=1 Tax=Magnolia sinica TaxID=86752 RepID=UPI002659D776|nr:protein DOG1-like 3 [Magnolia sinica]